MEIKKGASFFFGTLAVILGWTLFKQFAFETLEFKNTGLAIIYLLTFAFSIYFLRKKSKNKAQG